MQIYLRLAGLLALRRSFGPSPRDSSVGITVFLIFQSLSTLRPLRYDGTLRRVRRERNPFPKKKILKITRPRAGSPRDRVVGESDRRDLLRDPKRIKGVNARCHEPPKLARRRIVLNGLNLARRDVLVFPPAGDRSSSGILRMPARED